MQAVILAAGEGYRLRPFTLNKPKVMIKIANKPILEYVVEALSSAGIRDLVLVVGYRKSRVMDYFGDGSRWNVNIEYAVQEQQIGTAHALKQAEKLVKCEEFIVLAGDNIVDARTIEKLEKKWTLAYKTSEEVSKYGVLIVKDSKVKKIVEKPREPVSNLINTGVYRFGIEIFEWIEDKKDLIEVINEMINSGYEFECVKAGLWMDIVYPWNVLEVNDFAIAFSGKTVAGKIEDATIVGSISVGSGSVIRANSYVKGPCIIGKNCEIGPNAVIMPTTSVGNNVKIGALCYIENCVIGNNVIIYPNCYLKDCVIDDGCVIGPNVSAISDKFELKIGEEFCSAKAGAFLGENCEVNAGVVMEAGTILGNYVRVAHLKKISGIIPDSSTIL